MIKKKELQTRINDLEYDLRILKLIVEGGKYGSSDRELVGITGEIKLIKEYLGIETVYVEKPSLKVVVKKPKK